MADEIVVDGAAREQVYTAVDMGDDGAENEIYIAVDQSEADAVNAMVDVQHPAKSGPETANDPVPILDRSLNNQLPVGREDTASVLEPSTLAEPAQTYPTETAGTSQSRNAEQVADQPQSEAFAGNLTASASDASMVTALSSPPPPETTSALPIPPPAAPGTLPSENENFSAALERSSARTREKKEPALLGEFVSLDDMEGRSHLRFASKSPEVTLKALKEPAQTDADAASTPADAPRPSKAVFTPFTSIITGGVSVPASPSGSASGSRKTSKRKAPPSPGSDGPGRNAEDDDKRKRAREIVSPSSSSASFQTASSRIDEAMAKNKKPKTLAERLHDRPQASKISMPGVSAASQQSDERPAQASRAVSSEEDMDIDGGSVSPRKGPSILAGISSTSRAEVGGTTAFNPNQDDFMSLDIPDDDEEDSPPPRFQKQQSRPSGNSTEPRAFPDRGMDKGKGKATDSAMCAECGGIMAHAESCSRQLVCTSCNRAGHTSQYCSASWRDYVYYTPEEREAAIQRKSTIAQEGGWKYEAVGVLVLNGTVGQCYSCGESGHWGDDCPDQQWHEPDLPHTAFSLKNARLGPFAQEPSSQADPVFVQSKKLLHESAAARGATILPGSMGRERQKEMMRRQGGNGANDEEDEDDWFDKAKKGNQGEFPGRGNRLGQASNPRSSGNDRGNPSRINFQIRGVGNAARGQPQGNSGQRFYQSDHYGRNGSGARGGNYPPNDRDNAAHNFYSSGQGGGAVAEWETDYRSSDQHFRPQSVGQSAQQGRDRNDNGRGPSGRGNARGGGYSRNDAQQNRGYGGHRQNYYGGY